MSVAFWLGLLIWWLKECGKYVAFFENALTYQLIQGGASARSKRFRAKSAGMIMILLML
jgi:hypothetical protein